MSLNDERKIIKNIMKNGNVSEYPDDCSWTVVDEKYIFTTTDSITPETHIPHGVKPYDAGRFFASVNLSDIAAMGAKPLSFMAAFVLGPELDDDYVDDFSKGIRDVLKKYETEYIGGDTKPGKSTSFSGFCLGTGMEERTMFRRRIGEGQIVCVTNKIGRVGASYLDYVNGVNLDESGFNIIDIEPRIREAMSIGENGGMFMMDMSDGLFGCLSQMKNDYGLGFRIVESELPFDASVKIVSERYGISQTEVGCNIGGDYELLFTIENENFSSFSQKMTELGISVSYIGDVWKGDNMIFNGENWLKIEGKGWEHFK